MIIKSKDIETFVESLKYTKISFEDIGKDIKISFLFEDNECNKAGLSIFIHEVNDYFYFHTYNRHGK